MANAGIMKDSYVGGISSSSCIQQNDDIPFCVTVSDEQTAVDIPDDKIETILFGGKTKGWDMQRSNQTDEDKIIHLTCTDEAKTTNINRTEEYNVGYTGLSILPWEEFVFNPRVFNELFYTERNQRITYDPEEVNVFFHGKNVMPPTIGDISENGKSWNIDVDNVGDLRKVRKMLTERCSVFGVTIQYKEKRFAKPVRVPCLVLMDPNQGGIGDRLYTALTKAMDTIHNQRRFCVEINLNICVERWCKRVLLTDCKAVGAKLYVTNGEEYTSFNESTEDIICCALCFPIWLLQTCIYKLHRFVTYDDYRSDFDAEELFLHGSFQDIQYQRQQIFKETSDEEVFRTRCANQTDSKTLQDLGTYKFVCVKKVEKSEDENNFKEHNTATFSSLVDKRKHKVLIKDKKISEKRSKKNKSSKEQNVRFDFGNEDHSRESEKQHDEEIGSTAFTNEAFSSAEEDETEATPRIPEIASVLCRQDQDVSSEIEVPVDMGMKDENVFIKTTDSFDQDALDFPLPRRDLHDSKSMTAVCSFQIGSESETGNSGDDDEEEETEKEVPLSSSKENFIEQMKKIEGTLPKLQTKVNDLEEKNSMDEPRKSKKGTKTKSKKKIMVGQAFREITRTTNRSTVKESNSDEDKSKSTVEKEKSDISKTKQITDDNNRSVRIESNSKELDSTKVKVEVMTQKSEHSDKTKKEVENDESSPEMISSSLDITNGKETNGVETNAVSTFNPDDSSSDGDDVEMIYQSKKEKFSVSKSQKELKTDTNYMKDGEDAIVLEIEKNAKANKTDANVISKEKIHKSSANARPLTEIESDHVEMETDRVSDLDNNEIGANTDNDVIENIDSQTLYGVTKVEAHLDITDIDDIDEVGATPKPNIKVPPLKLNIGETLGKKAKRGSRQYNSNRKYLGASLPSKTKRMHKE